MTDDRQPDLFHDYLRDLNAGIRFEEMLVKMGPVTDRGDEEVMLEIEEIRERYGETIARSNSVIRGLRRE